MRETSVPLLAAKVVIVAALALVVAVVSYRREFILGTTQEFANYGDLARHVLAGEGIRTGLGQPSDLRFLRDFHGKGTAPPWPTLFRPLGPVFLSAGLMRLFGEQEWTVVAPALLGFVLTVALTVICGEWFFGRWIGVLAALPYLASRPILGNAFNAYPDSLFSAGVLGVFWVFLLAVGRSGPAWMLGLGLCTGLGQLLRVNMIGWLPALWVLLWFVGPRRRSPASLAVFTLGFAAGGAPEWVYALRHTGHLTRNLVGLENLANVNYGQTWLWYVPLSADQILAEWWRPILRELFHNAPVLAFEAFSGVEGPVEGLGLARRGIILGLFLAGLWLRGRYPDPLRRLYLLAGGLALWQVVLFAVLRQGTRYFFWFIPVVWFFALVNARLLADVLFSARPAVMRRLGGGLFALVFLGNAAALGSGWRRVDAEMHGFSPAELRAVRDIQLPALRRQVPPASPVASDRAFLLWYLGNPTIPLPLSEQSLADIERDYFAVDYLYLSGPFFQDAEGDPEDYARAYFTGEDGSRARGRSARLSFFLRHFPGYAVDLEFPDGGVLLSRRKGEDPTETPGAPSRH